MAEEVELATVDLRYEDYRMKNRALEARLQISIQERGIEEPLEGVDAPERRILLNGFKRYRCARRLHMRTAPFASLGQDEAMGIMGLLRLSNNKALGIIEQSRFIDDLMKLHGMNAAEIAEKLSRSKSWVSMRVSLMREISGKIRDAIFSGAFPVYPYMYTLRPFMRMNSVKKSEIEEFVMAVSGRKLSVREIEQLAHGFFRGPESFREEIRKGNLTLPLERLRRIPDNPDGCSEFERIFLSDLEIVRKYMQRVMGKSADPKLKSPVFYSQANLLTAGILSRTNAFFESLRRLHDRTGQE